MRLTRVTAMIGACAAVAALSTPDPATAAGARLQGLCGTAEYHGVSGNRALRAQLGEPESNLDTWGAKRINCPRATTIHTITVSGVADWDDRDVTFNVVFYRNHNVGNNPRVGGAAPQPNDDAEPFCSFSDAPSTYSPTGYTDQQWAIDLGDGCRIDKAAGFSPWVALQAHMDTSFGEFDWAVQLTAEVPIEADYRDVLHYLPWDNCQTFSARPTAPDVGIDSLMQDCLFGTGYYGWVDFMMVVS